MSTRTRNRVARPAPAAAAGLAQDDFAEMAAHDLRSPLNGIQSWVYVLERVLVEADPAALRALAGIKLGVQQQALLIEELLDFSRLLGGSLSLSLQPTALRPAIDGALAEALSAPNRKAEIAAELNIAGEEIEADAVRLQQIVRELLLEAEQSAAPGGKVQLQVQADGRQAVISIVRDGAMLPADEVATFFDWPMQAASNKSSATRRRRALIGRLCKLHGAELRVASPYNAAAACYEVRFTLSKL
jgi:signal transduction histidine kinase